LLSYRCVRRNLIFALSNAKIGEPGEEVLSEQSELRNLTPHEQKVRPLTAAVQVVVIFLT